jgi:hypothetical protein
VGESQSVWWAGGYLLGWLLVAFAVAVSFIVVGLVAAAWWWLFLLGWGVFF